jgi:hypothetical protein
VLPLLTPHDTAEAERRRGAGEGGGGRQGAAPGAQPLYGAQQAATAGRRAAAPTAISAPAARVRLRTSSYGRQSSKLRADCAQTARSCALPAWLTHTTSFAWPLCLRALCSARRRTTLQPFCRRAPVTATAPLRLRGHCALGVILRPPARTVPRIASPLLPSSSLVCTGPHQRRDLARTVLQLNLHCSGGEQCPSAPRRRTSAPHIGEQYRSAPQRRTSASSTAAHRSAAHRLSQYRSAPQRRTSASSTAAHRSAAHRLSQYRSAPQRRTSASSAARQLHQAAPQRRTSAVPSSIAAGQRHHGLR